jgi:ABC-2 type transport system permease protein
MNMLLIIAKREFKTLFLSPLAWTILAILQFIFAFVFLKQVEVFINIQPQLAVLDNSPSLTDMTVTPIFGIAGFIFLLVTPLLTMRLICEERRNKTLSLLLSAPISNTEIILGKYMGCFGLSALIVLLMTLMSLSLLMGGTLDFAKVFANFLALLLLTGAYSSVGLYMSCVTENPTVAAISAFGALFLLCILDLSTGLMDKPSELFKYLSILRHFQNIQSGLINTLDISYFLIFISLFIMLSIRRLDKERLQK